MEMWKEYTRVICKLEPDHRAAFQLPETQPAKLILQLVEAP